MQLPCSGGGTVTWSNNLLVDDPKGGEERSVTWDHCRFQTTVGSLLPRDPFVTQVTTITTDGVFLNGSARFHKQANDQYTIAWDSVEYKADNRIWRISGVETSHGEFGCGFDQQRVSNLLIESINSGDAVLFENFRTAIVGEPPESRVCGAAGLFNNWYAGRILHSRYGAVDVSTPNHMKFISLSPTVNKVVDWPATDPSNPEHKIGGQLLISGANHTHMRIEPETFRRFGDIHTAEYVLPEKEALAMTVSNAAGVATEFHFERDTLQGVQHGIFADLGGDDGDGMPNAWERVFNFDPDNAADGDQDIDGLSNVQEFQQMTRPYRQDLPTVDTDSAITVAQRPVSSGDPNDNRSLVSLKISVPTSGYDRKNWPIVLTLEGDARFTSTVPWDSYGRDTGTCSTSLDNKKLDCELVQNGLCDWNGCRYYGIDGNLSVELLSPAPVAMTATIKHGSADPNPANDSMTIILQR